MAESIKQIYTNIETLVSNLLNCYIGGAINNNIIKGLEYSLLNKLKNYYPTLDIILNISFNNYLLNTNIQINSNSFQLMSFNNYKSHNFLALDLNTYYEITELKCQTCNIIITESGIPIDGDYSCNEWLIKNIIE